MAAELLRRAKEFRYLSHLARTDFLLGRLETRLGTDVSLAREIRREDQARTLMDAAAKVSEART